MVRRFELGRSGVLSRGRNLSWGKYRQRPYFVGAARIDAPQLARDVQGSLHVLAIHDIEAQQLFLGLREGAIDHPGRLTVLAQRLGMFGRQQPRARTESTLRGEPLLHHGQFSHHRGLLLRCPGPDSVFVVVAKNGMQHGGASQGFGKRPVCRNLPAHGMARNDPKEYE